MMKKFINNKTTQKVYFLLCFTGAYLLVLFNRHFYDDEIGSIIVLNQAKNIADLYLSVNTWDVSPPFSYIIFFLLSNLSNNYEYITAFILPLHVYAFYKFYELGSYQFKKESISKFLFFLSIVLSPVYLLWCVSIRWYTLWTPLALIVITVLYLKKKISNFDIILLFIISTLMLHISYLSLIFFLSIFLSKILIWRTKIILFVKNNLLKFFFFILINLPQLYFFLFYHIKNSESQFLGYKYSIIIPMITSVYGNALLPVDLLALPLHFSFIFLFYFFLKDFSRIEKYKNFYSLFLFCIYFIFLLFITQLGAKARHSIILFHIFYFFIFLYFSNLNKNKFKYIFSISFIIFLCAGFLNIFYQKNTIKNNINLPIKKITNFFNLQFEKKNCKLFYIYTYNDVIKYYLKKNEKFIINYSSEKIIDNEKLECFYLINSYYGSSDINEIILLNNFKSIFLKNNKIKTLNIEYDKYRDIKNKFFGSDARGDFSLSIDYFENR